MANTNKLQIVTFLLVLLMSHHHLLHVEGSHLGFGRKSLKPNEKTMNVVVAGKGTSVHHDNTNKQEEDEVSNFRPTAPGRSPGVGHSINN